MNKSTVGRTRATAFRIPGIPAEIPVILNNLRKVSLGNPFLSPPVLGEVLGVASEAVAGVPGRFPARCGPQRKSQVAPRCAAEARGSLPAPVGSLPFSQALLPWLFFAPRLRKIQNPGPGGHESCSRCFRRHESFCPEIQRELTDYSSEGYSCACVCANPVPKGQIQHLESACTSAPAPFASTMWWCCRLGRVATTWECIGKVN